MTSARMVTWGQASAMTPTTMASTPSKISEVDVDLSMTDSPSVAYPSLLSCGSPSGVVLPHDYRSGGPVAPVTSLVCALACAGPRYGAAPAWWQLLGTGPGRG